MVPIFYSTYPWSYWFDPNPIENAMYYPIIKPCLFIFLILAKLGSLMHAYFVFTKMPHMHGCNIAWHMQYKETFVFSSLPLLYSSWRCWSLSFGSLAYDLVQTQSNSS